MHKSILKPIQQIPWQVTIITKLLLPEELPHCLSPSAAKREKKDGTSFLFNSHY